MTVSRRRDILEYIVNRLKSIDGSQDAYSLLLTEDSDFTLTEDEKFLAAETVLGHLLDNIYENVFRGLKYIDQINDFPSIYVQGGTEVFEYASKTNTIGSLAVILRIYTYEENAIFRLENLVEDIVYKIERINYSDEHRIIEARVISVDMDNGLLDPYGLGEIILNIVYNVDD